MMYIKEWFERKMDLEGGFIESVDGIERETEKAYLLRITIAWSSDLTASRTRWVPKSCVMTEEEYEAEREKENARYEAGKARHDKAYEFAKNHGLNDRNNYGEDRKIRSEL